MICERAWVCRELSGRWFAHSSQLTATKPVDGVEDGLSVAPRQADSDALWAEALALSDLGKHRSVDCVPELRKHVREDQSMRGFAMKEVRRLRRDGPNGAPESLVRQLFAKPGRVEAQSAEATRAVTATAPMRSMSI